MLLEYYPAWLLRTFAFLFGSMLGSFLNVAIYRWPREMSVVTPPSHCPSCGSAIPFYRNVPLLAYLFMRGQAPCCGAKLTPRYFLVELMSGIAALVILERWVIEPLSEGASSTPALWLTAACLFAFFCGLAVASFVDLEWMEIPDEVTLPGASLGLVAATFSTNLTAADAAFGAGAAFLLVQLLFVWGWERVSGQRGMGEGDSKLMLMIGAFVGWKGAAFCLVAAAFQGLLAFVFMRASGREFRIQQPQNAYGTVGVPGGGLIVDVAQLQFSAYLPGHGLLRSGLVELRSQQTNDTAPSKHVLGLTTPLATLVLADDGHAGVRVREDGSVLVEMYQGRGTLSRRLPKARHVHLSAGEAVFVGPDGEQEGPKAADAIAANRLATVPRLSNDAASKLLEASASQLTAEANNPEELALGWEQHRLLCALAGTEPDAALAAKLLPELPTPATQLAKAASVGAPATEDDADQEKSVPGTPRPAPFENAFGVHKLPFGPFLSLGALEYLFFGDAILTWYASSLFGAR